MKMLIYITTVNSELFMETKKKLPALLVRCKKPKWDHTNFGLLTLLTGCIDSFCE